MTAFIVTCAVLLPALTPQVRAQQGGIALGDLDGDGIHTVYDLVRLVNHLNGTPSLPAAQVPVADLNEDGTIDEGDVSLLADAILGAFVPPRLALVQIAGTSPVAGEPGVAVTRETIIRLTRPIADPSAVTAARLYARFGEQALTARVHVSPDRKSLTLFYDNPLPASAQVRVTLDGDGIADENGLALDGDGDGLPGGVFEYDFSTLSLTVLEGTAVCGRVFASEPDLADGGEMVNRPLEGVTITVDGMEQTLFATTDDMGNFRLEPAPAGRFFVHIDGRTSTDSNIPPGAYYPFVGKSWESIPGRETNIGSVYLPLVLSGSLTPVSDVEETTVEFPAAITDAFPELDGTALQVPAGSLFSDNGNTGGSVGIAPVDPERLPGQLPDGLNFPLVITVQTDGATNFDEPVPVCFPNLPDPVTGEVLAPGEKTALWSFNHDTGRFEVVGAMTVSEDGSQVCSDPGVGIVAPGWHGVQQGAGGSGGTVIKENDPENPDGGAGEIDPRNQPEGTKGFDPGADPDPPDPGHGSTETPAPTDPDAIPPAAPGGSICDGQSQGTPPDGAAGAAETASGDALDDSTDRPELDPIRYHSGEFYTSVEDFRIRGRSMDFVWKRKYRSRLGRNTAQGNGWDYSYNVMLFKEGDDLIVCNGGARVDRFNLLPNGTWARKDHFIVCRIGPALDYKIEFEDGGIWEFYALDGSPAAGRLSRITDRNGNRIQLLYNFGNGRLTGVIDTLGRRIDVEYTADGHIAAVQDFIGRRVEYTYVTNPGDPRGNVGDLISVRSPAVTGTPNGNDFPNGKTTTYTYSKHASDPNLRSNLLTITDGRRNDPGDPTFGGGPYVVNTYATTTDRSAIVYDRVLRQRWGDAGDVIDLSYRALKPYGNLVRGSSVLQAAGSTPPPVSRGVVSIGSQVLIAAQIPSTAAPNSRFNYGGAVTRTIVNDRKGNVTAYFYNAANQLVQKQEYTGRANPDQPTTSLIKGAGNAPGDPLRPGDPRLFRTTYRYNSDHLLSGITYPNGNRVERIYEGDLNRNADRRARANLREVRRYPGFALAGGSDQPALIDKYEYDTRFSACGSCGFNFVTKHTDPRQNVTRHSYDHVGNRIKTIGRIASIIDDYTYNQFGQPTSHTLPDNGSGHRRRDEYSYYSAGSQKGYLASQTVDAGGLNLTSLFEYDAVGNRTRVTDPKGNDSLTVYNQLDQIVRTESREVAPGSGVRYGRDFYYDANNNLVRREIENINAAGAFDANTLLTTRWEYEILNKLVRTIREVDAARSITTEFAYDANRNLIRTRSGEATNGNQPGNVIARSYDERDLLLEEASAPGLPEQSTTAFEYDGNRNLVTKRSGLEDTPRVATFSYDGYNRTKTSTDPMGNRSSAVYDANSNMVEKRVDGELVDVPGGAGNNRLSHASTTFDAMDRPVRIATGFFDTATQAAIGDGLSESRITYSDTSQQLLITDDNSHRTSFAYDTANRLATTTDAGGNVAVSSYDRNSNLVSVLSVEFDDAGGQPQEFTTSFDYDGLDRRTRVTDNRGNTATTGFDARDNATHSIDTLGNTVATVYDGLDRPLSTIRDLRTGGIGDGAPVGTIVTQNVWDDSSRLVRQIDPNNNATETEFDALNRPLLTRYADGTQESYQYDVHNNIVLRSDANGTVTTTAFDLLNRPVLVAVTPGAGVSNQTTFEAIRYDGLSRPVHIENDDAVVERAYNSLSHVTSETLDGKTSTAAFDAVGNMITCTYPGGRQIACGYDALDRKTDITDVGGNTLIASHRYVGPTRLAWRDFGNGTRVEFTYDGISGVPDPAGDFGVKNIVATRHSTVATGVAFAHHSYRWSRMGNKIARTDEVAAAERSFDYDSAYRLRSTDDDGALTSYALDGAHNRTAVTGAQNPGAYALDATLPEPADAQLNQYSMTPEGARTHDQNGNVRSIGPLRAYEYDFANRMVAYSDGTVAAAYQYDAFGRRIAKTVDGTTTRFFYTPGGSRVCEEQDAAGATLATYVYGRYIDDVIQMQRGGADYYYHCDDLHSTVALTDGAGAVVETIDYGDFGAPDSVSAVGNPYLFTGRRFDEETGLYYYRTRYMDPVAGRFTTRDRMGIWGDASQFGNGYSYAGNNPWTLTDPNGDIPPLLLAAGVAGGLSAGFAYWRTGSWEETGAAGVGGAVAGVVTAAGGAIVAAASAPALVTAVGLYGAGALGGALGTTYSHMTRQLARGERVDPRTVNRQELQTSAALGGAFAAVGGAPAAQRIKEIQIGNQLANSLRRRAAEAAKSGRWSTTLQKFVYDTGLADIYSRQAAQWAGKAAGGQGWLPALWGGGFPAAEALKLDLSPPDWLPELPHIPALDWLRNPHWGEHTDWGQPAPGTFCPGTHHSIRSSAPPA